MSKSKEVTTEKKEYPKQLIIKREGTRLFHFTKGGFKAVRVQPGTNTFNKADEIKLMMDHHAFDMLIESGAHTILNKIAGEKGSKTTLFTAMSVKQCLDIIANSGNIASLESLRAEEMAKSDRSSVIDAIKDQIKMLKNPSDRDLSL